MYKRNIGPIGEFLDSCPPQGSTTSMLGSGKSITRAGTWRGLSIHEPTRLAQPSWSRCIRLFQVWRSQQNGWVYDPQGIAPCMTVGQHSGVETKIIEYEKD